MQRGIKDSLELLGNKCDLRTLTIGLRDGVDLGSI